MDKKKSLIIIILALILALVVALMIQPKRTTTPLPLKEDQVKNVNFGIQTPNSEEEEKEEEKEEQLLNPLDYFYMQLKQQSE